MKEVRQFILFFAALGASIFFLPRIEELCFPYVSSFLRWQTQLLHVHPVMNLMLLTADLYLIWALFALVMRACTPPSPQRRQVIANSAFVAGVIPSIASALLAISAFRMLDGEVPPGAYRSGWICLTYALVVFLPGTMSFVAAMDADSDMQVVKQRLQRLSS